MAPYSVEESADKKCSEHVAGKKCGEEVTDAAQIDLCLLGKSGQKKHEYLYWELGSKQALRMGDWKAVRVSKKSKLGPIELYNLAEDIGETQDLAAKHPDKVKEMQGLMKKARRPSDLFPSKLLD